VEERSVGLWERLGLGLLGRRGVAGFEIMGEVGIG